METSSSGRTLSVSIMMLVVALLVVVVPFLTRDTTPELKRPPLVLRTDAELGLLAKDKDGNGNEDWKDLILSTMSSSTKAAVESAQVSEEVKVRLADPNNLTSSFSKNLYTASAFAANNKTLSEDEKTELIADILKGEGAKIVPKTYTVSDVSLYEKDSDASKRAYGNALALLLERANKAKLGSDELSILSKYNETKNKEILLSFVTKKEQLEGIVQELESMRVPISALIYHVRLLNAASAFVVTLDGFSKTDSDPVRSLAVFNSYIMTTTEILDAITQLRTYFALKNVPFSSGDPGYIFIQ